MSKQFSRIAIVNVFNRQETTGSDGSQKLLNIDNTGTQFRSVLASGEEGFRIKFHVQKATGPVPQANPCVITIYNLGPESRALVSKYNNFVVLQAGYNGNAQNIFQGNILTAKTKKEGPLYVTEIQVVDGLFAFQNSMVNLSFDKGVTQKQVMDTLMQSLKGGGVTPGVVMGVPDAPYNQGIVVSGKATDKIREIADKNNLVFSIQDSTVNILPYGASKPNPIISLSENTGLVGIPEIRDLTAVTSATDLETNKSTSVYSKAKAPRISFRCLLNPQLGCHQQVQILSKFVNGTYTTTLVSHTGDTASTEWYTDGEAS